MGSLFTVILPLLLPLSFAVDVGPISDDPPVSTRAPARPISVENRILGAQPGDSLTLEIGTDTIVAEVARDWTRSRTVELRRAGHHLKGFVGEQSSDLTLEPERITGTVGRHNALIGVHRSTGAEGTTSGSRGLEIEGLFGDRAVALHLGPDSIGGDVGPCRYGLRRRGGDYVGKVDCGGRPERVRMQVPVTLIGRDDSELAALMIALLVR